MTMSAPLFLATSQATLFVTPPSTRVLFPKDTSLEAKRLNWEYYEPRTEHGSSLSVCSYSIIAAQTGKIDWAYKYFMKTATIDLTGESKQYVGTLYIGGTHPAANGGAWMAAVLGLCGISACGSTSAINPHLPDHWSSVHIPLTVVGQKISIQMTKTEVRVHSDQPLQTPIHLQIQEDRITFSGEEDCTAALSSTVKLEGIRD
jgi:trehalose/maltose hydrolase-like predicted phosphorylase